MFCFSDCTIFLRRIYMKKFISMIAAVSMCALMLTACGDKTTGDENLTDSITAETEADVTEETSAKQEETKAAEDNSDDEDIVIDGEDEEEDKDTDSGDMLTFDSFDDISVDEIFAVDFEYIAAEESNLYEFAKMFEGGTEFYLDAETADGSASITLAFSQDKIAMNAFEGSSATEISMIIKDGMMYMLSPEEKTGFYMAIDESIMEEYDIESMLSQANIDSDMDLTEIKAAMVLIGGTEYVFEFNDESGMIFDTDGKLCAMISAKGSNGINTMIVNEFSSTVPADAFDVPDDYEIMDLASAFTAE